MYLDNVGQQEQAEAVEGVLVDELQRRVDAGAVRVSALQLGEHNAAHRQRNHRVEDRRRLQVELVDRWKKRKK